MSSIAQSGYASPGRLLVCGVIRRSGRFGGRGKSLGIIKWRGCLGYGVDEVTEKKQAPMLRPP